MVEKKKKKKKRNGNVPECQRLAIVVTVSFTDANATSSDTCPGLLLTLPPSGVNANKLFPAERHLREFPKWPVVITVFL